MRARLALLLLLVAPLAAASAQSPEAEVIAASQKIFDAMRTHDTTLLNSVLDRDAAFLTVRTDPQGKTVMRRATAKAFIDAVGSAKEAWNETIVDPEVRIDGDLATVWAYYDFEAGDRFSHCGYDAFQLARLDGAWKVVSVADTQRRAGCKTP
jgi:ketosteroid isomerase-like protein